MTKGLNGSVNGVVGASANGQFCRFANRGGPMQLLDSQYPRVLRIIGGQQRELGSTKPFFRTCTFLLCSQGKCRMTIGAFSIGARPIPGSSVSRPAEINGAQRLYLKLIGRTVYAGHRRRTCFEKKEREPRNAVQQWNSHIHMLSQRRCKYEGIKCDYARRRLRYPIRFHK